MPVSKSNIKSFCNEQNGSVLHVFALMLGVMMMFMGLAIDMSRLYYVRSKVQMSLDAASLAAAKVMDKDGVTDAEIQAAGEAYFRQNLTGDALHGATLTNFKALPNYTTNAVQATVDINLPTTLIASGGSVAAFAFKPGATAIYATTRLEIAMVLDVTGSMNDPSADGRVKLDAMKAAAKDFIDAIYGGNPQSGFVRIGLAPFSGAVNAGTHATQVAGFGADTCVVDRGGSQAYSDAVPANLSMLGRSDNTQNPGYFCPTVAVQPLTDLYATPARNAFKATIDGLTASGGTAGHVGVAWGWYLLSPNWSSIWGGDVGRAYSSGVKKIVVVLTDGQFNTAYNNGGLALTSPASEDPTIAGSSGYQALQLCNNIKSATTAGDSITIYTIGFTTPAAAETLLKQCSGATNFYSADNTNDLFASFRHIASKLVNLRISS